MKPFNPEYWQPPAPIPVPPKPLSVKHSSRPTAPVQPCRPREGAHRPPPMRGHHLTESVPACRAERLCLRAAPVPSRFVTDWRTAVIAVRLQRDEPNGCGPGMPAFPRAGAQATLVSVPENHQRGEAGPPDAEDGEGPASQGGEGARILEAIGALHKRLGELERLVAQDSHPSTAGWPKGLPAWKRVTRGEPRWQVAIATAVAIALQFPLPGRLVLLRPTWLLPVLQALLFTGLVVVNPRRINRESRAIRALSLTLAGILSLANAWSAGRLVAEMVRGPEGATAGPLLVSGGAIWLTNVIVFALWYWEFDRGGPVARANASRSYPDFQFV